MEQKSTQANLEKIEQDKTTNQTLEGLHSERPYQPNKGSFQEGALPEKSLKDLIISFATIYSMMFVLISSALLFYSKIIISYIGTGAYPFWALLCLGLVILMAISWMAYYICQKKIPKDETSKKIQSQFKTAAFGFSILLPLVLPIMMYSLWIIVPMLV